MELKNSKTEKSLMRAYAGETQAWARYKMAAERMRQQKLFSLAELFEFTAGQEQKHADHADKDTLRQHDADVRHAGFHEPFHRH